MIINAPVRSRVASLAFLKPNNSNLASFYSVWLGKISFALKLISGFFLAFFLEK